MTDDFFCGRPVPHKPKKDPPMKEPAKSYTYILKCSDNTLYTGWTTNLKNRLTAHNTGKGAKYTRPRRPVTLVYYETFPTKQQAMQREAAIKKLSRPQKERLIATNPVTSIKTIEEES